MDDFSKFLINETGEELNELCFKTAKKEDAYAILIASAIKRLDRNLESRYHAKHLCEIAKNDSDGQSKHIGGKIDNDEDLLALIQKLSHTRISR